MNKKSNKKKYNYSDLLRLRYVELVYDKMTAKQGSSSYLSFLS